MKTVRPRVRLSLSEVERVAGCLHLVREHVAPEKTYEDLKGGFMFRVCSTYKFCYWVEKIERMDELAVKSGWILLERQPMGDGAGWKGWCLGAPFSLWRGMREMTVDNLPSGFTRCLVASFLQAKSREADDISPFIEKVFRLRRLCRRSYCAFMTLAKGGERSRSASHRKEFADKMNFQAGLFSSYLWYGLTASDSFLEILSGNAVITAYQPVGVDSPAWLERETALLAGRMDGDFVSWYDLEGQDIRSCNVVLTGWALDDQKELEEATERLYAAGASKVFCLFYYLRADLALADAPQLRLADWYEILSGR